MPIFNQKMHISLKHSFWMGDIIHFKLFNHLIRWENYLHDTDFIQILWTDTNGIKEMQEGDFIAQTHDVFNVLNSTCQINKTTAITEFLEELRCDCAESTDLPENLYTFVDLKKIFDSKKTRVNPQVLENFNDPQTENSQHSRLRRSLNLTHDTEFPGFYPSLRNLEPSYVLMISFENYLSMFLNTLATKWESPWIKTKYLQRCLEFVDFAKSNQMFYHIKDSFMMPLILPRFGGFYTDIDILPGTSNPSDTLKSIIQITEKLPRPKNDIFILKQIKGNIVDLFTGLTPRTSYSIFTIDFRWPDRIIREDVQILIQPFGINRFPQSVTLPMRERCYEWKRPLEESVPSLHDIQEYADKRGERKKKFNPEKIKTLMDYFSEGKFDFQKYEKFRNTIENLKDRISKCSYKSKRYRGIVAKKKFNQFFEQFFS